MKRILAIASLCLLAACTSSRELERQADAFAFPPAPSEQQVRFATAKYFKEKVFTNPSKLQYQLVLPPYRAWLEGNSFDGGGMKWIGWAVDIGVSRKGSAGPFYDWQVLFDSQGNIAYAFEAGTQGTYFRRMK